MKRILISAILAITVYNAALGADCIALGLRGEIQIINDDGTSRTLRVEVPVSKDEVTDACYDAGRDALYCRIVRGYMYELHTLSDAPIYERIDDGILGTSIILDNSKRPLAVKHSMQNGKDSAKLVQRQDGAWGDHNGGRLLFERLVVSPTFVPDGDLTKMQILAKYPYVESSLTSFTAQSEWVVKARSETVDVYSLMIGETTRIGEPYRSRLLMVDSANRTGRVLVLDEYSGGFVYLFQDSLAIRGQNRTKSGTNAGMLNFSGNYYVYDLRTSDLKEYLLGKEYDVLGATRNRLYLGKENSVYVQPIGNARGAMWLYATLAFRPFKIFPLENERR